VKGIEFMPYLTVKAPPVYHQISFEDMLAGIDDLSKYVMPNITNTRTYWVDRPNDKLLENTDVSGMIEILKTFNQSKEALFVQDRASLYHSFYIPKSSGGLRRIDAPLPELMTALRELKTIFETRMFALYHTTAFAYVCGRSTIDAIKRHQRNESKWFLKLDFSNFFGSTTPTFVFDMMTKLFPFSEIVKRQDGREELTKALSLCFLNDGLPQGTPISPFITNVMMIPIDHRLANTLRNFDNRRFIYTRYADDILVSCKIDFNKNKIEKLVSNILSEFSIATIYDGIYYENILLSGEELTLEFTVHNTSNKFKMIQFFVGMYDYYGNLIDVSLTEATIDAYSTEIVYISTLVPGDDSIERAVAYIWDNLVETEPYVALTLFPINARIEQIKAGTSSPPSIVST